MKSNYWVGNRPSGGKAWAYTDRGCEIADPAIQATVTEIYRHYARLWNEIELDRDRSLEEHTHQIAGASAVNGGGRMFALHAQDGDTHWVLELLFARGFDLFGEGMSFAMTEPDSLSAFRSMRLHWNEGGQEAFSNWLKTAPKASVREGSLA
ncbi:MAG: hypothetical protein HYX47_05045 [Burkholderiales bacterium]|nr:hypothetical protein [Burkholderiales bacterium]